MITNYDESFNGYDPRNNKKTRLSVISYLSHITSSRGFHGGGEAYRTRVHKLQKTNINIKSRNPHRNL